MACFPECLPILVIYKPELLLLPNSGIAVCDFVSEQLGNCPIFDHRRFRFTPQLAQKLWPHLGEYEWAHSYWDHMASGPSALIVASTNKTQGDGLKQATRTRFKNDISILKEQLGSRFSPDLIHTADKYNAIAEWVMILQFISAADAPGRLNCR